MNFFEDAVRFFSNMKKEASAKHILIKGAGAVEKLNVIKAELVGVEDLSGAFSELASKVVLSLNANHLDWRHFAIYVNFSKKKWSKASTNCVVKNINFDYAG